VRADTGAFVRDVDARRAALDGPLARGADAAGSAIERALIKAARTGRFGFDDLRRVALQALGDIAASAIRLNLGGPGGRGGAIGQLAGLVSGLFGGAPGRATGGPVVGGRAYVVGERGPELFVPTAAGDIHPAAGGAARTVNIRVTVNAPTGADQGFMARSGRQVAREVLRALHEAGQ
jgi:phage-related minor tail protein